MLDPTAPTLIHDFPHQSHCYCAHCNLPLTPPNSQDCLAPQFCCSGCAFVYHALHQGGLEYFYTLRGTDAHSTAPPNVPDTKHHELDLPTVNSKFVSITEHNRAHVTLQLGGVHCLACIWLVEQLPTQLPGVHYASLKLSSATAEVAFDPTHVQLSQIVTKLNSFGYTAAPIPLQDNTNACKKIARRFLARIGIAGACAGNVMLIAIALYQAEYSGITAQMQDFLAWTSMVLTLPSITFGAFPFYASGIGALRHGKLHIDLPISVALITAYIASTISVMTHQRMLYFDSITALIFLLLIGRYLQFRATSKAATLSDLLAQVLPLSTQVEEPSGHLTTVAVEDLVINNLILIPAQSIVPADSQVYRGTSHIDNSILTGESSPIPVKAGDRLFAGTKNLEGELLAQVTHTYHNSRLAQIVAIVREGATARARYTELTQKIAEYFVVAVMFLVLLTTILWWQSDFWTLFERIVALLVISCPCAVGLGVPLLYSGAITKAFKRGIIIRGSSVIERLSKVNTIYFDKTGTLTAGSPTVHGVQWIGALSQVETTLLTRICLAMEWSSTHPFAKSIRNWAVALIPNLPTLSLDTVQEEAGKGVRATYDGHSYILGSVTFINSHGISLAERQFNQNCSAVVLARDKQPVAIFELNDLLRPDAHETVMHLRDAQYTLGILSGDQQGYVSWIATQLKLARNCYGQLSPEEKASYILNLNDRQRTAFIGDGINDAPALEVAGVGIGFQGEAAKVLAGADAFISSGNLKNVVTLLRGSRRTQHGVAIILCFALSYNLLGSVAAILGLITPLWAAILMPISSLIVVSLAILYRTY